MSDQRSLPKLGFLASHNGSSMQAIVKHIQAGNLAAQAEVIISNNPDSGALAFAKEKGITGKYISRKTHSSDEHVDAVLTEILSECDWIILSGYMRPIGPKMLSKYAGKIFNIHPQLYE